MRFDIEKYCLPSQVRLNQSPKPTKWKEKRYVMIFLTAPHISVQELISFTKYIITVSKYSNFFTNELLNQWYRAIIHSFQLLSVLHFLAPVNSLISWSQGVRSWGNTWLRECSEVEGFYLQWLFDWICVKRKKTLWFKVRW